MDARGVFEDLFQRGRDDLVPVVDLSDEELYAEPLPSIAWYAWRMGRTLDRNITGLMETNQIWVTDGWAEHFGMAPDAKDFLPGFPPPDDIVRTFRAPSAQLLLDYYDAIHERTKAYLDTLSADDFDRVLDEQRPDPRLTVSVRLVSVAVAVAQSSGPVRYRMWLNESR
jgi:hypothetical protein